MAHKLGSVLKKSVSMKIILISNNTSSSCNELANKVTVYFKKN
ncbi:hypothetical protein [Borreliella valaisiana]|uniref:Uncharacterized protein n=1 Tax=Borreliella valaisiana VS116 TaxID=445987 RepID=C0R8T6_BORVA|nr:hypothetical protein [Borreliella valaisiana]ACN52836.1 hypothetical protein BVAVS116_E0055 [Borreliella valaisiana VS116]